MWLITGPFDAEVVGELNFQKTKLLKTDTTYPVGRKDRPLTLASKKVSHDHCEFIVGNFTVDQVGEPTSRPSLHFNNKKDKGIRVNRGDHLVIANPSSPEELQDGDVVSIITGLQVTVKWESVCCYAPNPRGKAPVSLEACASLGIHLVQTPNSHVTHHLTLNYIANALTAASLVSASQFVKPEWLHEVVRLGNLPKNSDPSSGTSLEDIFSLPQISKFRPNFSPSLPPSQKIFKVWEPNEERLHMFQSYRFICIGEKAREIENDMRGLIHRGGGSLETFDVQSGVAKLHKALTRSQAKEGKKTVVVGDDDAMSTAIGIPAWKALVVEAKSFNSAPIDPERIVQAVFDVDATVLDNADSMDVDDEPRSSPLPDVIPNTLPEEPSLQPSPKTQAPVRRLTRRVVSREPSVQPPASPKTPEPESQEEASTRPRRALTRRVNGGKPLLTGLDDPSSILDAVPDVPARVTPPPMVVDLTAPTPARSSRLKRRVGGAASEIQNTLDPDTFSSGIGETIGEPPLKRFKALFEASNPDQQPGAGSFDMLQSSQSQTQTQSQTQSKTIRSSRGETHSSLGVLREEEEESQSIEAPHAAAQRGTKRDLDSVDGEEEMGHAAASSQPAAKKMAVENVNAVEKATAAAVGRAPSKPPSTVKPSKQTKTGAPAGKPDTDAAFLKAIASTKRGKKTEDAFDREFNNLKISKPDFEHEEQEKEWNVLADFGDDSGIRGNFMVVMEMEVFRKDDGSRARSGQAVNIDWEAKPNFKKYKKKFNVGAGSRVELIPSEINDYGIGPSYWKGGSQTQNGFDASQIPTQPPKRVPRAIQGKTKIMTTALPPSPSPEVKLDSDEEIPPPAPKVKTKPPSRAGSALPPKRASSRSKEPAKAKALFLDSDDDIKEVVEEESHVMDLTLQEDDEDQTLRSSAGTKSSARSAPPSRKATRQLARGRKAMPVIVDDDSDDGVVFKGFRGNKKR